MAEEIDFDRIRKIANMLASNMDGDVLAAARRLAAIAKAHNLTVGELLFHPRASSPQPTVDPRTWSTKPTMDDFVRAAAAGRGSPSFEQMADFIRRQAEQSSPGQRPKRDDFAGINWLALLREIREYAARGLATFEQIAVAELAREQLAYHIQEGGDASKWRPASMDAAQIIALARNLGIVLPVRTGA